MRRLNRNLYSKEVLVLPEVFAVGYVGVRYGEMMCIKGPGISGRNPCSKVTVLLRSGVEWPRLRASAGNTPSYKEERKLELMP